MRIGSLDHLLPAAKAGDKEAWDNIYMELKRCIIIKFKREKIRYNFHGYDNQDIIQDTISIVHENIHKIDQGLKAYAYQVLKNKVGDKLRQTYGVKHLPSGDTNLEPRETFIDFDPGQNSHLKIIDNAHYNSLLQLMGGLKEICKLYFSAFYKDCMHELHDIYKKMYPENSI